MLEAQCKNPVHIFLPLTTAFLDGGGCLGCPGAYTFGTASLGPRQSYAPMAGKPAPSSHEPPRQWNQVPVTLIYQWELSTATVPLHSLHVMYLCTGMYCFETNKKYCGKHFVIFVSKLVKCNYLIGNKIPVGCYHTNCFIVS